MGRFFKKLSSGLWRVLLRRQTENPFGELRNRLRVEEETKRSERKKFIRQHRSTHRRWNREVKRLLYQLADALREGATWHDETLFVNVMPPSGDPPRSIGWRLFWVCAYGQAVQSSDIVTVSFRLDDKELPASFIVFKEASGQQVITNDLSRSELIQAIRKLFP